MSKFIVFCDDLWRTGQADRASFSNTDYLRPRPEISIFRRFRHTAFVDNNANVRVADDIKRSTSFTAPLSLAQGEMLR